MRKNKLTAAVLAALMGILSCGMTGFAGEDTPAPENPVADTEQTAPQDPAQTQKPEDADGTAQPSGDTPAGYYDESWETWDDWNTSWDDWNTFMEQGDVSMADYPEFQLLNELGIVSASLIPGEPVTRGAFCKVVNALYGVDSLPGATTQYSDLPPEHKAYQDVMVSVSLGLLKGYPDGTFRPDEPVTFEQAASVLMALLGYDDSEQVEMAGSAYTACYGTLVKGTKGTAKDSLMSEELVVLAYNALHCTVSVRNVPEYTGREQNDLLWTNHHIYEVRGIVEANELYALSGAKAAGTGQIRIDDTEYDIGETNADQLVGYGVRAYVKAEGGENWIVSLSPHRSSNITINARDIQEDTTPKEIRYETENGAKSKRIGLDSGASVIYNGEYVLSYDEKTLNPDTGRITIIDNDNDGKGEVVFVFDCVDYVVTSTSKSNNTITTKYEKERLSLSPEDYFNIFYELSGEPSSFNNIGENDTISLAKSKSGNTLYVFISKRTINGKVTAFKQNPAQIQIGEDLYYLSENFMRMYQQSLGGAIQAGVDRIYADLLGTDGTFHLNHIGEVSGVSYTRAGGMQFGYLQKIKGLEQQDGVVFRIFTEAGKFEEYVAADRFKLDGEIIYSTEQDCVALVRQKLLDNAEARAYPSIETIDQLVRFNVSSKGILTSINTEFYNEGVEAEDDMNVITTDRERTFCTKILDGCKYDEFFIMPAECVVFNIPAALDNEPAYGVVKPNTLDGRKTVYGYGVENCMAKAAVISSANFATGDVGYPVLEINDAVTEDASGDEVITKEVVIAEGGKPKSMYISPNSYDTIMTEQKLRVGDVIQYGESGGFLVSIFKAIDWQNPKGGIDTFNRTMGTEYHYDHRYIYGSVTQALSNKFGSIQMWTQGTPDNPSGPEWHTLATVSWYVEFNRRTGRAKIVEEPIDPSRLLVSEHPNARIFLYTRYTETRMAMIIVDE